MATCGAGELLRRERVRRQRSLEEVSQATKISMRFLRAIETEDFEVLPGLVFARNFVRQYASFLELDPVPLVAMLPRLDLDNAPMPRPREPLTSPVWDPRWNSTLASVAWTVLAASAAVGAYLHFNHSVPAQEVARAAVPDIQPQARPAPSEPVSTAPVPAATSPVPTVPAPSTSHPVEVVVTAREESWVQATADGKPVFTGTMKAGETRSIDADQLVKIRTGNAGGVDLSLNGKPVEALGPVGQIRSVTLTAEGLQAAPAAPLRQSPPPETSPL